MDTIKHIDILAVIFFAGMAFVIGAAWQQHRDIDQDMLRADESQFLRHEMSAQAHTTRGVEERLRDHIRELEH